jgi:hypothetical protein
MTIGGVVLIGLAVLAGIYGVLRGKGSTDRGEGRPRDRGDESGGD